MVPSGRPGRTPPPPEARGRLQLGAPPLGHSPSSGSWGRLWGQGCPRVGRGSGLTWAAAARESSEPRRGPCSPGRRQRGLQPRTRLRGEACRHARPRPRRLPRSRQARPSAGAGGRMGSQSYRPVRGAWALLSALHCPRAAGSLGFSVKSSGSPLPPSTWAGLRLAQLSPARCLSLPPWCRWQACPPRPTPGPFGGTRHPRMDSITSSRNYLLLCLLLSSFCRTLGCCSLRSPYPCLGVWGCRGQQGGCGVVTGNRAGTVASRLPSSMTGDPRASEGGREVSPGAQMAQEARMPSSLEMPPGLWE